MKIGFKIKLDKEVNVITPDGFDGVIHDIAVEMNRYALSYEEMMQSIFVNPERAYFWKEVIEYAAGKIIRDVMKVNNVDDLHKEAITFYIIPDDEYTDYIVNLHPCGDYTIQRVAYNLVDIDGKE